VLAPSVEPFSLPWCLTEVSGYGEAVRRPTTPTARVRSVEDTSKELGIKANGCKSSGTFYETKDVAVPSKDILRGYESFTACVRERGTGVAWDRFPVDYQYVSTQA